MYRIKRIVITLVSMIGICPGISSAQEHDILSMEKGLKLEYACYDGNGKKVASYSRENAEISGDPQNGYIMAEFHFYDNNGKPFFSGDNLVSMKMGRRSGKAFTEIDNMFRFMKIRQFMTSGDPGTLSSSMKAGDELPDSSISVKLGKMEVTVLSKEKEVLDSKDITTAAGTFGCTLVREHVFYVTPIGTQEKTSETWYAPGAGVVKQKTYEKGVLKLSQELVRMSFK